LCWNYSQPVASLLRATFGNRFQLRQGYSMDTLPPFVNARANRTVCDLLLVDGGHTQAAAMRDLQQLRPVASPHAHVVVDDINTDPGEALRRLAISGQIRIKEVYNFKKKTEHNPCQRKPKGRAYPCTGWGFAIATYNYNSSHGAAGVSPAF
jgi:hypothetical protein